MSEPNGGGGNGGAGAGAGGPSAGGQGSGSDGEFKAITTQAEFNAAIGPRLQRERERFADYDQVKAKADQLDRLADTSRNNEDAFNERIAKLEADNVKAGVDALRYRIAADKNISRADADLFLLGSDEASITAQADALLARDKATKKNGNHVPGEGNTPGSPTDPMREMARAVFGKPD